MHFTKSSQNLVGILYRPPDKCNFVNCLEPTFSDVNVIKTEESYCLGDFNKKFQPKDKEMHRNKENLI